MVFFTGQPADRQFGMARAELTLLADDAARQEAIIAECEALSREQGVAFRASGARDPRGSLAALRPAADAPWQACMRPWTTAYITANGNCLPCCVAPFSTDDYESLIMGNLFERPFAEVWNAPRLSRLSCAAADRRAARRVRRLRRLLEPVTAMPNLWIYTNYDCNLCCTYCLARSGPTVPRRAIGLANVQQLVDEAVALGFTELFFTGGEPTLLDEIYEMLAYASARMRTHLLTNAMLLRGPRLERLVAIRNANLTVQVSLDGANRRQHDPFRGEGSWAKTVEGIRLLKAYGFHVTLQHDRDGRQCGAHGRHPRLRGQPGHRGGRAISSARWHAAALRCRAWSCAWRRSSLR